MRLLLLSSALAWGAGPVRTPPDITATFEGTVSKAAAAEIRFHGDDELVPVDGTGEQHFRIRTMLPLRTLDGGRITGRKAEFLTIAVDRGPGSTIERRRVVLSH